MQSKRTSQQASTLECCYRDRNKLHRLAEDEDEGGSLESTRPEISIDLFGKQDTAAHIDPRSDTQSQDRAAMQEQRHISPSAWTCMQKSWFGIPDLLKKLQLLSLRQSLACGRSQRWSDKSSALGLRISPRSFCPSLCHYLITWRTARPLSIAGQGPGVLEI